MGLTHSWLRSTELPTEAFALAVKDCSTLVGGLSVPLAGFDGTGPAFFGADAIIFNGARPAGCEPFVVKQTEFDRRGLQVFWSFCKTEGAPYNVAVKAVLIVLKHHLGGDITVNSDESDEQWDDARTLCNAVLGYGQNFRLDPVVLA